MEAKTKISTTVTTEGLFSTTTTYATANLANISSSPCRKPHKTAIEHQVGKVYWQNICCAMVDVVHGIHQPSKSIGTNSHSAIAVLFNRSSGDWVQFSGHTKSLHLTQSIDIGLNLPSNNVFDLLELQQGPTESVKEFVLRVKKATDFNKQWARP